MHIVTYTQLDIHNYILLDTNMEKKKKIIYVYGQWYINSKKTNKNI